MKLSMRHLNALFRKDLKNCFTNKNVLLMIALPVFFTFIFKFLMSGEMSEGLPAGMMTMMGLSLLLSVIPLSVLAQIVAEEKEKHTLRSLFLANVKASEFLISKVAVSIIMILFDGILIFFIVGDSISILGYYILFLILSSIGILFFGAIVGLLAKDQMNAGTLSSPLMILLMLPPLFSEFNPLFKTIAVIFPTTSIKTLYLSVANNQALISQDNLIAIAVCIVWVIVGIGLFSYIYKKRGLDD